MKSKKQEFMDKILLHLSTMEEQCFSDLTKSQCAYRGENGGKCFVGALIPDDKYAPEMDDDGESIRTNEGVQRVLGIEAEPELVKFLDSCQAVHDRAEPHVGSKFRVTAANILKNFCERQGLEFNAPESLLKEMESV